MEIKIKQLHNGWEADVPPYNARVSTAYRWKNDDYGTIWLAYATKHKRGCNPYTKVDSKDKNPDGDIGWDDKNNVKGDGKWVSFDSFDDAPSYGPKTLEAMVFEALLKAK